MECGAKYTKIHKVWLSLLPTNLLYNKKIDFYNKELRKSKKKEMPCFYRYLYNPTKSTEKQKAAEDKAILY